MNWVFENKKLDQVSSEADTEGRFKNPRCGQSLCEPRGWDLTAGTLLLPLGLGGPLLPV